MTDCLGSSWSGRTGHRLPSPRGAPEPEPRALPAWVEAELANRRAFWAVLRNGGALTPEVEAEAIRREVEGYGENPEPPVTPAWHDHRMPDLCDCDRHDHIGSVDGHCPNLSTAGEEPEGPTLAHWTSCGRRRGSLVR